MKRFRLVMVLCGTLIGCGDDPAAPPCRNSLRVVPDSIPVELEARQGAEARPARSDCLLGAAVWTMRDLDIAEITSPFTSNHVVITGKRVGTTWIVAHFEAAPQIRDSARVIVRTRNGVRVVSGVGQTDTVGAVLPEPLVVQVRDLASGVGIPDVIVRFVPGSDGRAGFAGPFGRQNTVHTDTTDAFGHASAPIVLLGPSAGAAGVIVSMAGRFETDTATFTALPGHAQGVLILPADTATLVGKSIQLRAFGKDRNGNVTGPIAASYELITPPAEVNLSPAGLVTGLRFGQALIRASAAGGQDTAQVRVFPAHQIVGTFFDGRIATGFLDGSGITVVPGPIVRGGSRIDWSPDGLALAFDGAFPAAPFSQTHVFLAALDGTSRPLVPAFQNTPGEYGPRYSPDGRHIYFTALNSTGGTEIWRSNVAGDTVVRLGPSTTTRVHHRPSVSHDGRRVAFISAATSFVAGDVLILDVATGQVTDTGVDGRFAEWSPSDDLIAVDFSTGMLLIRPDGTVVRDYSIPNFSGPFAWSDDAAFILSGGPLLDLATGGWSTPPLPLQRRDWRP